jgi:hypothetical protein
VPRQGRQYRAVGIAVWLSEGDYRAPGSGGDRAADAADGEGAAEQVVLESLGNDQLMTG